MAKKPDFLAKNMAVPKRTPLKKGKNAVLYEVGETAGGSRSRRRFPRKDHYFFEEKSAAMKKSTAWMFFTILYAAVGAVIVWGMITLFRTCSAFRGLFYDKMAMPAGVAAEGEAEIPPELIAENVRQVTENAARLSFSVLVFILLLQFFAFLTALIVFRRLAKSQDPISIRLKKLENADLFLDLPLYFGLFGTVSSFVIMSFNPQVSRLIAYSSTLVGIIFSVLLRLTMQYPLRQKFIALLPPASSDSGDKK